MSQKIDIIHEKRLPIKNVRVKHNYFSILM